MMVGNQAPADDPVLLEISRDDWILILDYIYNNLEYDSESEAKNDMIAAMDRIRNAHYFYNIERKDESALQQISMSIEFHGKSLRFEVQP